ncbi:MAG: PHP domain-containing protein [Candidatus Eremiobacteraeota bacterium]|nr:PHP domain-containing protein [Candidatus Eremiobacteraeota bacterium]
MLVDFHSHTLESDGTLEPAELAATMRARGVSIFSITDHDALGAYDRLDDAASHASIIIGIELNTTYRGSEVHILGYGFPLDAAEIGAAITENRRHREARAQQMVDQLGAAGVELTFAEVRAEAGSERAALGRPHVARALVRKGYASDINGAFRSHLVSGKPGYVPQHYMAPHEAVALIGRAGGVAVLAHPGRLKDESIIDELVAAGLAGIETFYPRHDANQIAHYRDVAADYGLVMTAGSDFHDPHYNERGVGMEVERDDIAPFLDLVL